MVSIITLQESSRQTVRAGYTEIPVLRLTVIRLEGLARGLGQLLLKGKVELPLLCTKF